MVDVGCSQIGNKALIMRLLGREKLPALQMEGEQVRKWISSWVSEITRASWKVPFDLIDQFPTVQVKDDGLYVFSVCESGIFLELRVAFAQGVAVITAIVKKI